MVATLICRVEARLCALRADHVVEIMRPLPIEPIAAMPPFVRGLAVVRGVPIPVVDAAMLLGAAAWADPGRFVTVRAGDRWIALAVDEVLGVRDLSAASTQRLPPLLREGNAEMVAAIGALDAAFLVVLHAAHILPRGSRPGVDESGEAR